MVFVVTSITGVDVDADLRDEVIVFQCVGGRNGGHPSAEERDLPEQTTGTEVAVKGIHRVVLRRNKDHIVAGCSKRLIRNVEWWGVDKPIHRTGEKIAEGRCCHCAGIESVLFEVLSGTCDVIVMGEDSIQISHSEASRCRPGSVSLAGRRNRVTTNLCARRIETRPRNWSHSGAPAADIIHRPIHSSIGRSCDRCGELLCLRCRQAAAARRNGNGDVVPRSQGRA